MSETREYDWRAVPASDTIPTYDVYIPAIQKSPLDDRDYRAIRLKNGLRALLVHDAEADKSAASLNVTVGHLSDPDDIPGLAHFCEHLLFMGTEKYPKENEYKDYLYKNGGGCNASTNAHRTNYYFYVNTEALPGALDRFSGVFSCPLFMDSCTTREINAVDSENKMYLQQDNRRYFQLSKHLSKPDHIWRKFGTGNKETLTVTPTTHLEFSSAKGGEIESLGSETRRRVIAWWKAEYCASRMALTVVGRESLEELANMVSALFSPVEKRAQSPPLFVHEHPYGPNELETFLFMKTVKEARILQVVFPIAWQDPLWKTKPLIYVGHFVGHEGPGSLLAHLKKKGWANSLRAGASRPARGFANLNVTISLTKEGLDHYQEVLVALFKYLALLRSSKLDEWVQNEIRAIKDLSFRFAEKSEPQEYTNWISEHLHWTSLPLSLVLSGTTRIWDWDEALVRESIAELQVRTSRVVVKARGEDLDRVRGKSAEWLIEKWYGTEYCLERMDEDFVRAASGKNDIEDLYLPGVNEYIPTELEVNKREVPQPSQHPDLLRDDALLSLWHKEDDQFWRPKANVVLDIRSCKASDTSRSATMTRLFAELVADSLTETTYDASLARLHYSIGAHTYGLKLEFWGYSHKLPILARTVLERVKTLAVDEERLRVIKERVEHEYRNFFLDRSCDIADYYGHYLLTERQWTLQEKLEDIVGITKEDVRKHAVEFLSRVYVVCLVHGNMSEQTARSLAVLAEETLRAIPVPQNEREEKHSLLLPQGCNYIYRLPVPNPKQLNSALSYYLHGGDVASPILRTTFRLLAQLLTEPAFATLRTKEQLGYIVSARSEHGVASIGLRVRVQSERDPAYLEERVEAFLLHMEGVVTKMSEEQFGEHKRGLKNKWLEKLNNLSEEYDRFWAHINSGYLDFTRAEKDAKLLDDISKEDVLSVLRERLLPNSPTRSKLSVHIYAARTSTTSIKSETETSTTVEGATYIEDAKAFRASLRVSEPSRPVEIFRVVPDPRF